MTPQQSDTAYGIEHGAPAGETIVFLHGGNVAGWMWQPQVELLPDRHLLTPDLPGYGERFAEQWPGLAGAADTSRPSSVTGRLAAEPTSSASPSAASSPSTSCIATPTSSAPARSPAQR